MEPPEVEGLHGSEQAASRPETFYQPVVDSRLEAPADTVVSGANPVEPEEPEASPEVSDIDVMLSMLAAEHREGDPTSRWVGGMEDKATRIAVMVGGTVVVAALGFLMLTVLGAIF